MEKELRETEHRPAHADCFARTELLVGAAALDRWRAARVVVAGLGGVGSFCVECLARSAVGTLVLIDFDKLNPSNINRQILALHSTLGQLKVDVARARALDINPACRVDARNVFIDEETVAACMDPAPDVVIDAIDSVNPKATLIHAAVARGIPIVSCMGSATRQDPLAVRVGDLAETAGCPLARMIRKRLKKRGVTSGVRCVYSVEPANRAALAAPEPPELARGRGRPRRPLGSLCVLPGVFGLVAAREALRIIML